jgi:hypothetical protein
MSAHPSSASDRENAFPDDNEFDSSPAPAKPAFRPRVIPIAEVPSCRPAWLWRRYIPAGKLTVLDGDPGAGKSIMLIDLAARVSRDGVMPDGTAGSQGHAILVSDEPLGDTMRPQLEAAGANLARISVIRTVATDDDHDEPFVLPRDLQYLRDIVIRNHAQLLIFDPFTSFIKGDVTQTLRKLAFLAEETGCAIVLTRHLAKNKCREPLYRGAGPLAIIAAARSALLLARDPELPERRVLAPYKNTLGRLAGAITFTLPEEPPEGGTTNEEPPEGGSTNIVWGGVSEWTAEQLLAPAPAEREQTLFNDACRLLEQATYFHPRDAASLRKEAHQIGISDMTLRRAKAALGLRSQRQGFGSKGTWYWYRPDDPMFGEVFTKGTVESGDTLQFRDRRPGDPLTFATSPEARARYTNNPDVRQRRVFADLEVSGRLREEERWTANPALDPKTGVHKDEQEWEKPGESADTAGDTQAQLAEFADLLTEAMTVSRPRKRPKR